LREAGAREAGEVPMVSASPQLGLL